jgi:hypothetical protein
MLKRRLTALLLIWSCQVYRLLLLIYPAEHRREYGAWMRQAYRDQCRAAVGCSLSSLFDLWFHTLLDGASTAYAEHLYSGKRSPIRQPKNLVLLGFTLLTMVWVGYVDLMANEM